MNIIFYPKMMTPYSVAQWVRASTMRPVEERLNSYAGRFIISILSFQKC